PTGIAITCDAPDVPVTEDNLAWRAADLVRRETGAMKGVRIHITKAIPVAAGLGGGSSDAAAVLVGLGRLWGVRLRGPRVQARATLLGMDVPFFLGPSPALASGRGEVLHPLAMRQTIPLVVANPGVPLATREVYGALGPADFSDGGRVEALAQAGRAGIAAVAAHLVNGLEPAASRPSSGLRAGTAAPLQA